MFKSKLMFLMFYFVSAQLSAFPCILTMMKGSCWADYEVNVEVSDMQTGKSVTSITVPKGKLWERQEFTCEPNQKLDYTATFTPIIWEGTEGKVYNVQRHWSLPTSAAVGETAWEIPLCFPEAFAEVPLPPRAKAHCDCDLKSIPLIPPK